jgi:site-specific DNA-methyltransferase (adenine-specific)
VTTPYYSDDLVRLFHGDCREITEWLAADVLVTDPPYGVKIHANHKRQIQGDDTTVARDAALALWGTERPALVFGRWDAPRPAGVRRRLIWDKGNEGTVGDLRMPWASADEEIYVLGRDWPKLTPGGRTCEGGTPARVPSVIRVPKIPARSKTRPDHPTPKPVALLDHLVQRCPAGVIADPFAGSGSTLLAARQLGRRAIGVEIDERYCELIATRLSAELVFS